MSSSDERFVAIDDVLTAHLEGEAVLLDMESRSYFQLNETGALLWRRLEKGASREELLHALCEAFVVERAEAGRELDRMLEDLLSRDLIRRPDESGADRVESGSRRTDSGAGEVGG